MNVNELLKNCIAAVAVILLSLGVFLIDEPPTSSEASYERMSEDERRYLFDFCSGASKNEMLQIGAVEKCNLVFKEY